MKASEKTTRARLIEAAVRRFRRDGFRNVGIDQVFGDVGISKTAFYKHFESKDDLMLAVLAEQSRTLQELMAAIVRGVDSAAGQLRAVFDLIERIIEGEDFHGCIFVSATMEFPLPHDPAHVEARKAKQVFEDALYEIAEHGGAADPRGVARELCLILEGAYVTRHVTGDPATINIARRVGELVIARHFPQVESPRS